MQTVNNVIKDVLDDAEFVDRGLSISVNDVGSCLDRDDFRVWNDDNFNIVCSNISERYRKINKRLAKFTSADILACIKFESASQEAKLTRQSSKWGRRMQFSTGASISLENLIQCGSDHHQDSESNCNRSAVECKAFPKDDIISLSPRKPLTDYVYLPQTPGRRRPWKDNITHYDNPFDPRLSFNGLAHLIRPPSPDRSRSTSCTDAPAVPDNFNCLIESECPTQFTNAYLAAHRANLRALIAEAEHRATGKPVLPTVPDINHPKIANSYSAPGFVGDSGEARYLWNRVQCTRCLWQMGDDEFKAILPVNQIERNEQLAEVKTQCTPSPEHGVQWTQQPPTSTVSPEHVVPSMQQHASTISPEDVVSLMLQCSGAISPKHGEALIPPQVSKPPQKHCEVRKSPFFVCQSSLSEQTMSPFSEEEQRDPRDDIFQTSPPTGGRNLIARVQTRHSPRLPDGDASVSYRTNDGPHVGPRSVETKAHAFAAPDSQNQQKETHDNKYSLNKTNIDHKEPAGSVWSTGSIQPPVPEKETICSQGVDHCVPSLTTGTTTSPSFTEVTQFPHRSSVFWSHQQIADETKTRMPTGQCQEKTVASQVNQLPLRGVSPLQGYPPQQPQQMYQDGRVPLSHLQQQQCAPVFHPFPSAAQSEAAMFKSGHITTCVTPSHTQGQCQYRQFVTPTMPTVPFYSPYHAGKVQATPHQQPQPQPHVQYNGAPQESQSGDGLQNDKSNGRQVAVDDEVWYINGVPHYNARPMNQCDATTNLNYGRRDTPPTPPQVPRPWGMNRSAPNVGMIRPPFFIPPTNMNLPPPPPNALYHPCEVPWQVNSALYRNTACAKHPTSKSDEQKSQSKLNTNNNSQSDYGCDSSGFWGDFNVPNDAYTDITMSKFSEETNSPKGDKITVLGAQMRREEEHFTKKKKLRASRADLVRLI